MYTLLIQAIWDRSYPPTLYQGRHIRCDEIDPSSPISLFSIVMRYKLPEYFIEEHSNVINWSYVSSRQVLSEPFIERHRDKVDWDYIPIHQVLSEPFIERNIGRLELGGAGIVADSETNPGSGCWSTISGAQFLSESFIEKYSDKIDWPKVSKCQKLSESFITKYTDKVSWYFISGHQELSEDFLIKHQHRVNWFIVYAYQKLTTEFGEEQKWRVIDPKERASDAEANDNAIYSG